MSDNRNTYLDQVVEQQQQLEQNLRARKMVAPVQQAMNAAPAAVARRAAGGGGAPAGADATSNAVDVRITGFWRWKTVVVPPNAYVVHTRRGVAEPLHLGLGVSFRYNPYTDAFLVVPGAMQTILINARCICQERQGLLVQGYVQWIIQDIGTAYKKLDFSDAEDPMRVVTLQLREQAEAAIKDKVATMSIDDVLSDKQPIIEELTARLRSVAEGAGGTDKGLGLRIVTVQVKEAVVSSSQLWESLQKPFRAERARVARLAELEAEEAIAQRELEQTRRSETARLEMERELSAKRAQTEAEAYDRQENERVRRAKTEAEHARDLAQEETTTHLKARALETQRQAADAGLERMKREAALALEKTTLDAKLAMDVARAQSAFKAAEFDAAAKGLAQGIENGLTPAGLQARLVAALPGMLEKLPRPNELKTVNVGSADGLSSAVAQVLAVLEALKSPPVASTPAPAPKPKQ
ncbi:MAG: SPFH domain-containing protein [Myxococcota bacterium]